MGVKLTKEEELIVPYVCFVEQQWLVSQKICNYVMTLSAYSVFSSKALINYTLD